MLQVCVEQKDGAAVDADGEGEEEYGRCAEGVGSEVVKVEDREEGVREDRACDADGGWKDDESGDFGVDARIGEMEEAKGKEEEDDMLLDEAAKRSGD